MFELTQTRRKILKYIFGILFVILFTGPVLICVGIALMIVPTDRADKIDEYNSALGTYDVSDIDSWANGGEVNSVSLVNSTRFVQVYGADKDVTNYNSKVVDAEVASSNTLQFNIPSAALTFTRNGVATSKTRLSMAVCQNGNGCSNADMQAYCVSQWGAGSSFTGPGDCQSSGYCYECSHEVFLTEYCAVLRQGTGSNYIVDPTHASCFYPFTANNQRYESTSATPVLVTLRKSNDPFMTLQRLTEGRMDFGQNVIPERMAGYGLLVAGIIMTLLLIFLVWMIKSTYNDIKEAEEENEARKIRVGSPTSPASEEQK